MVKSIDERHAVMLSPEEGRKMLLQCHCFSGINYATKQGSSTHKIRLVTNSSSNHPNGSLNSHTPKGINMIGNLKSVFTKFSLKLYAVIFDLARAYRSLYSSGQTNGLRLMWWIVNPEQASTDLDAAMRIFMLERVTYGDVGASTGLELAIRKIITLECKTALF